MRDHFPPILLTAIVTVLGVRMLSPGPQPGPASGDERGAARVEEVNAAAGARTSTRTDWLQMLEDHWTAVDEGTKKNKSPEMVIPSPYRQNMQFLIATVHDPFDSSSGYRFDTVIDAIQHALARRFFVLDRVSFPWERPGKKTENGNETRKVTLGGYATPGQTESADKVPSFWLRVQPEQAAESARLYERQPGVMLFRSTKEKDCLLALFLVGETATRGIHKRALTASLDFIRKVSPRHTEIRILGPTFSGSRRSLAIALKTWVDQKKTSPSFRIISGGATAFDKGKFKNECGPNVKFSFAATVIREDFVLSALLDCAGKEKVAILQEDNTAFGLSYQRRKAPDQRGNAPEPDMIIPFPMHISAVRGAYNKSQGKQSNNLPGLPTSVGRVRIPFEDEPEPRDTEPTLAPAMTAAYAERILATILSTIAQERIHYVAILATDVKDKLFLASVIRDNYPDVQLLLSQSDLMLSHPDYRYYLKGAIVASTYPLYSNNQRWSYPFTGDKRRVLFPSQTDQGYYNATVALLSDGITEDHWLDYGEPFKPNEHQQRPPIWLSILGQDGPHPLTCKQPSDESAGEHKAYLLSATPVSKKPDEKTQFLFRHPRLWTWAFVAIMFFCGMHAAGMSYILLRAKTKQQLGNRWEFIQLLRPFRATLQSSQDVYSLICFSALTALSGYIASVCAIPYVVKSERDVVDISLRYLSTALIAWLMFAGLLALTLWRIVLAIRRRAQRCLIEKSTRGVKPEPREGQERYERPKSRSLFIWLSFRKFCSKHFLLLITAAFMLSLATGLLRSFCAGSYRPMNYGKFPDGLFFFERASNLGDGVNPVLPVFFLSLAFFWWGHTQLKRLRQIDRTKENEPFPFTALPPLADIKERYHDICRLIARPSRFGPLHGGALAVWLALLFGFCRLYTGSIPSVEGSIFDGIIKVAFAIYSMVLVYAFLYALALWRRLRRLLQQLTQLPILKAFDRLPETASRAFGPYLSSVKHWDAQLSLRSQQLRAVAAQYAPVRNRLRDLLQTDDDKHQLDEAMLYGKAIAAQQEMEKLAYEKWQEAKCPKGSSLHYWRQAEEIACKRERKLANSPANVANLCSAAARACLSFLSRDWGNPPVSEPAGEVARPLSEGMADAAPDPMANRKTKQSAKDPLLNWKQVAEDLVALEITNCVSQFLVQLRGLVTFVVVGVILLLLAILSYPFQPQHLLLIFLGTVIIVFAVGILRMLIQIEVDSLLSRILNTTPNRMNFNPTFFSQIATSVVPLLGALAATSPDVLDLLHSMLDPVYQVLK